MKGGRILRIKTDTWRRIRWDLALGAVVGIWSWWWRTRLTTSRPGYVYFSDTWDYVNIAHDKTQPPDPFHSPFIETLWRYGTNHHFNEVAIAHLQQMAGVVISVAMYVALRGVAVRWVAFPLAIGLSISPLQLFSERAFLTECGTTLFVVLGLAAAARMLKPAPLKHSPWWLFVAALSFGTAAAVRPALQLFAVAAVGYLSLQYVWRYRRDWRRWQTYRQIVFVAPLMLILTALPMWNLQNRYHHYYGTSSPTPAQGVVLLTRWGHLVPCSVADNHKGLVRQAIRQVCEQPFGELPGSTTNALWQPGAVNLILREPTTLRRNSKTLARITQMEIRKQPAAVLSEIKRSVVWQLTKPPVEPQALYHNGYRWFNKYVERKFPHHLQWFGGQTSRLRGTVPFLAQIEKTILLPQILLWLAVGLAVIRGITWLIWRRARWAWNHMIALAILLIGTGLLSVALGSIPGFRYWIPLQPGILILLAGALWPRRRLSYDEIVPADLPNIQ